jgi:hypothetical protein
MKIPSNNQWTQTNEGKKLGILGDTFNVNLETPGQLISSQKSSAYLHQDQLVDLSLILAVLYYANDYIVITPDEAYRFSLNTLTISTISSYPSGVNVNSDAVICFNRMYVSLNDNLSYWNGSSWTNSIEALTSGVPHPMDVFDALPTFKLAIGNGNEVILVDSSGNKSTTSLILPAQFRVTTLRYRNGYLYVGTRNIYGGDARVFIWNGSGTNAQYEVPTGASWVFSMVPYQTSVVVVTDIGELLYINGSSVQQLAAFPVFFREDARWQDHLGLQSNGKVFNRGMEVLGDSIYINIDGEVDIGESYEMKSGLWVYNPKVGLYHTAQASSDRILTDALFSLSNSEITTDGDHYMKTGDAVIFNTVSGITGVTSNTVYYAKVTGADRFKLATSRTALQADNLITIGGSRTSDVLMYSQNRDQGTRHHTSGAIGRILTEELVPKLFNGQLLYGARLQNLDGDTKNTLQIFTDSYNVSRYTTQRVYSDNIQQSWKEYYAFIDGVRLDNEELVLSYNNKSREQRQTISGVWLNSNTINIVANGTDVTTLQEHDEIVITDGYGRGYTTFITSITSGTTYSIEVTDSIGTTNESVTFYSTPARHLSTINNTRRDENYAQVNMPNISSPWVTLQGEMRGFQTEISHLELANIVHKNTQ